MLHPMKRNRLLRSDNPVVDTQRRKALPRGMPATLCNPLPRIGHDDRAISPSHGDELPVALPNRIAVGLGTSNHLTRSDIRLHQIAPGAFAANTVNACLKHARIGQLIPDLHAPQSA